MLFQRLLDAIKNAKKGCWEASVGRQGSKLVVSSEPLMEKAVVAEAIHSVIK